MGRILAVLARMWNAQSYHITRHNCVLFADAFVEKIGLGEKFPVWLKKACLSANETPAIASFVDTSLEVSMWYMKTFEGNCSCTCQQSSCCPRDDLILTCDECLTRESFNGGLATCTDCRKNEQTKTLLATSSSPDLVMAGDSNQVSCEYMTIDEWRKDQSRRNGYGRTSVSDNDSYCIVHSFTRLAATIVEIRFEVVHTLGDVRQGEEPCSYQLFWDGGVSVPTTKTLVRNGGSQLCAKMVGVLVYEGVPDELLKTGKSFQFQYASANLLPVRTKPEFIGLQ